MEVRKYKTYQDYVRHQASKLGKKLPRITVHDKQYENIVYGRYKDVKGKSILCLAARLGGEVRAFKRRGATAIGIDLNPGKDNPDVIQGDFHDIPFGDNEFDIVFCNSLDHVLYMDKFLKEVKRVSRDVFILELSPEELGNHAARSTTDQDTILSWIKKYFTIEDTVEKTNKTSCLSGNVFIYILKKKP